MLEQSDGSGWMGMFCLNMMRIALELARENPVYEGLATKFFQHYVYVAAAMKHMGNRPYALWDDQRRVLLRRVAAARSIVREAPGAVAGRPGAAVRRRAAGTGVDRAVRELPAPPRLVPDEPPDLVEGVVHTVDQDGAITHVLTIVTDDQLGRILERVWDPAEFLSDYGIRSLSKTHEAQPFVFEGQAVGYEPAEAVTKIKGGNSNWRGPIWFPTCFL